MISEDVKYIVCFYYYRQDIKCYEELSFRYKIDADRFLYKIDNESDIFYSIIKETIKVYSSSYKKLDKLTINSMKDSYKKLL